MPSEAGMKFSRSLQYPVNEDMSEPDYETVAELFDQASDEKYRPLVEAAKMALDEEYLWHSHLAEVLAKLEVK